MHEKLAYRESGLFATALRGEWQEGQDQVISIEDWEPMHFDVFFQWTYERSIFTSDETIFTSGELGFSVQSAEWDLLAKAWTLGNYLQAMDFKDAIVDALVDKVAGTVVRGANQTMHSIIYPNSTPDDGIRELVVDIAASRWTEPYMKTLVADAASTEFFRDLSIAAVKRRGIRTAGEPWERGTCKYHEHVGVNKPCYRTRV
jgi:hypothetical protein